MGPAAEWKVLEHDAAATYGTAATQVRWRSENRSHPWCRLDEASRSDSDCTYTAVRSAGPTD